MNCENMIANMHVGDIIFIQDLNEDGKDQIGVRQYKDPLLVSFYGVSGVENCILVTIISVVEVLEQQKLFYPILATQYCKSLMGNDSFLTCKGCPLAR